MAGVLRERTIGGAICVAYLLAVRHYWFVVDDAFISFRFARNLIEGHGLRYNLGDHAPVEGYSNFLWVLACAPFEALHLEITRWPLLLSSACGLALLLLVARRLRSLGVGLLSTSLAVGAMAVFPPFAAWSTSGLETMPFALLLFWTFDLLVLDPDGRHPVRAGIVALLLALVRIEGVLWSVAILALAFASHRSAPEPRVRRIGGVALMLAIGYGAYTGWRLAHFHELIPNTVYAKSALELTTLIRGANYVASYALMFLTPLLILPASIAALGSKWRTLAWPSMVVALAVPGYAIAATGDWMPFGRLLVSGVAFQTLLWAFALDRLARSRPMASVAAGAAAVVVAALPLFGIGLVPASLLRGPSSIDRHISDRDRLAQMNESLAERITRGTILRRYAESVEPAAGESVSIVESAIGAIGYYSHLRIYDRIGLVSPEVAHDEAFAGFLWQPGHDKWRQPTYFLDRRPTILWQAVAPRSSRRPGRIVERMQKLYRNTDVASLYAPDVALVDDPELGEHIVAAWILIPDGMTRAQMRRRFRARLAELGLDATPTATTRESLRMLRPKADAPSDAIAADEDSG
jgi:arabinofuranosyltransferase